MVQRRNPEDVLAVSLMCTAELARTGGGASVERLAYAAGVSTRTFHRYFPRKEDCVRPALRDAGAILVAAFRAHPRAASTAEAFLAAFGVAAGGAFAERSALLIPVVLTDPALSAVWEHEIDLGAAPLAAAIAERASTGAEHRAALACAAVLLAMVRLAFRRQAAEGGAVVEHLRGVLDDLAALPLFSMSETARKETS